MQNLIQFIDQSTDPAIGKIKADATQRNLLSGNAAPISSSIGVYGDTASYSKNDLFMAKQIQQNQLSQDVLQKLKDVEGEYTPAQIQHYYATQIKPQIERQYGVTLPDTYSGQPMAHDISANTTLQNQNININNKQGLLTGLKNSLALSAQPSTGFSSYANYGQPPQAQNQKQVRGMDFSFNSGYLSQGNF